MPATPIRASIVLVALVLVGFPATGSGLAGGLPASYGVERAAGDGNCTITFRMTTDATVGNLGWETDYTNAPGGFAGEGDGVDCTALVPVLLGKFDDDAGTLTLGWIAPLGVSGTTDIVECTFVPTGIPKKEDFSVTVTEAGDPETNDIVPPPVVEVHTISCAPVCGNDSVDGGEECDDGDTDFQPGDFCSADCSLIPCGSPGGADADAPKASDALFILHASVGTGQCDVRVCDVNASGSVTASDALLVLEAAVGIDVAFDCPL
ncbi:MAG TPA: hypothetical protein VN634_09715 [Candidatus Limnocylindrales bacterium]|nr:hypothetical protein [Candidatus Limnocylindrales bacterium]